MAFAAAASTLTNQPVKNVDLERYSGKWYVVGFIPTSFDKDWDYTTETYTLNKKGDYDIYTTYRKNDKEKDVRSKGFISKRSNAEWKVQFVWPFRADYWVIELADDYSWTVVGHPKQKFLYIMSRTPQMNETLYQEITARCREKGYDTKKLRKQLQK
jgi:apolipoprotein D and lipocalin family protein